MILLFAEYWQKYSNKMAFCLLYTLLFVIYATSWQIDGKNEEQIFILLLHNLTDWQ